MSRILVGLALAATLGACVERGDFGRVKPSVWNGTLAAAGTMAAAARGEPVSLHPFTDDETELRGRAWRFLVPARGRPWLDAALAELVATRIVPADAIAPDRHAYHRGLLSGPFRSPTSLYRQLSEDISGDTHLVQPVAAVASRVLAADRVRLAALRRVPEVDRLDRQQARARVAENRCLVAWVAAASAFRVGAYRYALDHLVLEAPQPDAVPTERALTRLAAERTRLDALGVPPLAAAACAGDVEGPAAPVSGPPPEEPLVRKG